MKLHELKIHEAHELLKKKEISSSELTQSVLGRIREIEEKVGAYITVDEDFSMAQAIAADKVISEGNIKTLTGIPLGIKDLICTKGMKTTCGSKFLDDFVPPYDATVMAKLYSDGAVVSGKLNMDEFAMGSSTENSAMKLTRNPWDLSRIPGGSSGGSAAAVAADMCLGSLGSDTGGSIRQPASHCGVVGIKPTYGSVSRYGLVAYASSLDQIGPITKDVRDSAILMNAICGFDGKDSTSARREFPDFVSAINNAGDNLKGIRIGLPEEYNNAEGLDPDVAESVKKSMKIMESLGAEFVPVSLPNTKYAVAVYYVIAPCEASSNLARYDGVRYGRRAEDTEGGIIGMYKATRLKGLGEEVKRRIIIGTYALSEGYYDAYYGKAAQVRTLIKQDFNKAFEKCDMILSPVAPTPAFKIGEKTGDPLTMYLSDIFTLSTNLAGIPGISVPCGYSKEGLPIGLQLQAGYFCEEKLLKAAYVFEKAAALEKRKPAIK
ncbi:Asp-tRNA(Asn)/Glu-tRNA(Gln) amidotransferase subunit GatA [Desulforegula conservatrix]|uniref:Asp-tRNA(Asn)/Glu-tRNA(Gln) amidotransferase subunit GatA n=1 Tax=Desulforegula conservatrix TaxID=153026 RepID=UPI0004144314|nr:Asp-tRNA(Asn)/Glu-tRNA(Gln) amidotransferase subunit GatA [Desulforegula conservatrix]